MKTNRSLAVLIMSLVGSYACADQLIPSAWVNWIIGRQPVSSFNGAVMPELSLGAVIVPATAVPAAVRDEQRLWVERIVRANWVPGNLRQASRAARFLGDDILVYRKEASAVLVQVSDDASGISVLLKPNALPTGSSEERIRRALVDVILFPENKLGVLTFRITPKVIDGAEGFTFTASALESTPIGELAWWQSFQGFSDGRSLLLRFPKLDGTQQPINAGESPGSRLRFNIN